VPIASNHHFQFFSFRIADKDYKQGQMTLAATEFLRRFFLHVLLKGFVRIRHFGFLANRCRASRLALGRQLLASGGSTEQHVKARNVPDSSSLWHCPRCGASMTRDSEIHRCGTISMHILRFFLMLPSPMTPL
jgi:hypothetical protein